MDTADLGVATTSLRSSQQLGTAFGFALYSTIVARYLDAHPSGAAGAADIDGNLDPGVLKHLPPAQYRSAVGVFIHAVDIVFVVAGVVCLAAGLLALVIREKGATRRRPASPPGSLPADPLTSVREPT
ncbi:hypothetical protein OG900_30935 [Streptomyces sp. NBC_00433]